MLLKFHNSRVTLATLLVLLAGTICVMMTNGGAVASSRWGKNYLPNVTLTTQDNKPVRFYDDVLKGKITVISFIYTTCRDICPLITARLAQVYDQLGAAAGRDIHFVSISIDPQNDTPAKLKEHADAFRSDPKWVFLTGDPIMVQEVRRKLGERSRKITEHAAQVMLYNDRTGEWSRDSAFADLGALTIAIRSMDPAWRTPQIPAEPAIATSTFSATAELPGQALYIKACAACHSIGLGDLVGPDLKDVSARREKVWLQRFVRSPAQLHSEKDPIAIQLAERFPRVRMPNLQLSESDVTDLMTYIDARSFTATDAANGQGHDHATAHTVHSDPSAKTGEAATKKAVKSDPQTTAPGARTSKSQPAAHHHGR